MHVGTFTPEGSWNAALRELPALAELGITCLEIMPVAEFSGRFGWGYDGVDLFAPTRLYGEPVDFRRFVDGAHALGIAVILDGLQPCRSGRKPSQIVFPGLFH
jgi:maltooligosyltrehalose trehalohydrolase